MGIFGKKKKDNEEEDELDLDDEELEKEKRPLRRRKKKGEEDEEKQKALPKPWGKKERIWILILLLLTSGTSGILALSARSWKLPGLPRITLPNFSKVNLLKEETIVIEGDKENVKVGDTIVEEFNNLTKDLSGVYGLYVVNLDNGYSFGVNENEIFEPASLQKLPVILASYKAANNGDLDLRETYVLKNSDKIQGSGSLSSAKEGTEYTYQELIDLMGSQSDNTAFGILRKRLGSDFIDQETRKIGMLDTSLSEYVTTPQDIGIYFKKIYEGSILDADANEAILDSLTDTIYEDWIVAGIPSDIRVSHKFGREVHVVNDAGIVFSHRARAPSGSEADKPFVLVIMSKGVIESEADTVIPQIARMVYGELTKD